MNLNPTQLVSRTFSFVLLRLFMCTILVYPLYKSVQWGISFGEKYAHSKILLTEIIWAYLGFSLCFILIEFIRKPVLHWITYAHVASMTEVISGTVLRRPLTFGLSQTFKRFGATGAMFIVDSLLIKSVKQVSKWIMNSGDFVPKILKKGIFHRIFKQSIEVVIYSSTECIMSYIYKNPEVNVWDGCVKGATLYIKSWKSIVKSALIFTLKVKLFFFLLKFLTFVLSIYLVWDQGFATILSAYVAVRVMFIIIEVSLIQPYQLASMLLSLDREQQLDEPDPTVSERVAEISSSFKEMIHRGSRAGGEFTEAVSQRIQEVIPQDGIISNLNLPAWAKELFPSRSNAS